MKAKRFLFGILFAICALAAYAFDMHFGLTAGTVLMGMAGVVGVSGEGEGVSTETMGEVSDLLDTEIEEIIVEETRSRTPISAILHHLKKRKSVKSLDFKYYAINDKPLTTTVTTAIAGGTLTTVSIPVADNKMFTRRDTVSFRGIAGYKKDNSTSLASLMGIVIAKTDDGIRVEAINGERNAQGAAMFADAIPVGTEVIILGKAESEKAAQTESTTNLPAPVENHCQNFMFQVSETEWAKKHAKNVKYDLPEMVKLEMNDFSCRKELSYIFSERGAVSTEGYNGSEPCYTTDGILTRIEKVLEYDETADNIDSYLADWMKSIFELNNGSQTRYAFLGGDLYLKLQKTSLFERQVDGKDPKVVFGIEFDRVKMGGNVLMLTNHQLLTEVGYGAYGLVLDLDNIEEKEFVPFTTTNPDLRGSGQMNADAMVGQQVSAVIVKNPETHAWIRPA